MVPRLAEPGCPRPCLTTSMPGGRPRVMTWPGTATRCTSPRPAATRPTRHRPTRHRPTRHRPTRHRPTRHRPTRHRPTRHRPTRHRPAQTQSVRTRPVRTPAGQNAAGQNAGGERPNIITGVATTDATVPDAAMTEKIHATLAGRELLPAQHYLDSGYPSAALVVDSLHRWAFTLVTPLLADQSPQARAGAGYDRASFTIDFGSSTSAGPPPTGPQLHLVEADDAGCRRRRRRRRTPW